MTVYLPPDCVSYRYDFWWRGDRHTGSTDLTTKTEAHEFEAELRKKLRRRRAGLEAADASDTPAFSTWSQLTYQHHKTRKGLKRPEQLKTNLRMAMGFWGARPSKDPIAGAPYHDYRLGDPIADPELLERFEQWMEQRGISGSRKNHYRSACSVMYKLALLPSFRKRSQVRENPFAHIPRDRQVKRITTYKSSDTLRTVIITAAWHIRIALAIGALAPKLRLRNVLALRWDQHVAEDLSQLTNPDHKTDRQTGLPMVTHVSKELRKVLEAARRGRRGAYVVHYRGKRVHDIKTGLKSAVKRAGGGLVWGRAKGVTYHTLRHTMATDLVRMRVPGPIGDRVMGWLDPQTRKTYEHLVPIDEIAPLETLGERWPMADLVEPPGRKRPAGRTVGLRKQGPRKPAKKRAAAAVVRGRPDRKKTQRLPQRKRARRPDS